MSTQHASIIKFQVKSKEIKENTEPEKQKQRTKLASFMIENKDKATQSQERTKWLVYGEKQPEH